jgi:ketosteroid isomerase-like protein
MGGELEKATRGFFDLVDRKDGGAMIGALAEDPQSIDEISRRWLRGTDEVGAYIRQMVKTVDDVHSSISDVRERVQGEIGLMTCWIEQDYTLEGKSVHVSAPTTLVFRREGGAWKVLLFHSVPLPAEDL